ncbi:hypothetical protein HAX54_039925 [Datura stramonium]|uniref:Uncharacterized protein n=1 Tax=Datura stramonium TaxID=4076 RepID=A0ABS8VQG7_DATST|nr:hypothetical protein [Datura stramonium]
MDYQLSFLARSTGIALWQRKEAEFQWVLLMSEVPRHASQRIVTGADGRNWLLLLSIDGITLKMRDSCYI